MESRADLDSAKTIGQPKVMAEALRKIRLEDFFPCLRGSPLFKVTADPNGSGLTHIPMLTSELLRLKASKSPEKIENTFLTSLREVIKSFLRA